MPARSNYMFSLGLVLAGLTSGCSDFSAGMSGGRANGEMNKGDYDAAIADYTKAIESDPTLPTPYINRGLARQAKGDVDGALADDDKAIELNPNYAAAYHNRGLAKMDKHDYDGAIADYTRAIELSPNFAVAYYNRSLAEQAKGDAAGALADHNKAIKLAPQLWGTCRSRSHIEIDRPANPARGIGRLQRPLTRISRIDAN